MKTLIVNLFGAPGSGKSTGAAYIFSMLKMKGINAELVTEFAKDKVWEDNTSALKNQYYIFGNQNFRISKCLEKTDVIITDSPTPLSIVYGKENGTDENFNSTVMKSFNKNENLNYYIKRVKAYQPAGRVQKEDAANEIGEKILQMLHTYNINYKEIEGNIINYNNIITDILRYFSEQNQNVCVMCGEVIPEGTMVCRQCEGILNNDKNF